MNELFEKFSLEHGIEYSFMKPLNLHRFKKITDGNKIEFATSDKSIDKENIDDFFNTVLEKLNINK